MMDRFPPLFKKPMPRPLENTRIWEFLKKHEKFYILGCKEIEKLPKRKDLHPEEFLTEFLGFSLPEKFCVIDARSESKLRCGLRRELFLNRNKKNFFEKLRTPFFVVKRLRKIEKKRPRSFAESRKRVPCVVVFEDPQLWKSVLVHELFHIRKGKQPLPRWKEEGLAEFYRTMFSKITGGTLFPRDLFIKPMPVEKVVSCLREDLSRRLGNPPPTVFELFRHPKKYVEYWKNPRKYLSRWILYKKRLKQVEEILWRYELPRILAITGAGIEVHKTGKPIFRVRDPFKYYSEFCKEKKLNKKTFKK